MDSDDGPCHVERFELGNGENLVVPRNLLRFNGGRIQGAPQLFHGDVVRGISWFRVGASSQDEPDSVETLDGAGVESPRIGLDISGIELLFSPAREVYQQVRAFQIVHRLTVEAVGDRFNVVEVEALNRGQVEKPERQLNLRGARLDEGSEERLRRLLADSKRAPSEFSILGRLDSERFVQHAGKEVVFQHVSPKLGRDDDPASLRPGCPAAPGRHEEAERNRRAQTTFLRARSSTGGSGSSRSPEESENRHWINTTGQAGRNWRR
jgi:hypothetical protein